MGDILVFFFFPFERDGVPVSPHGLYSLFIGPWEGGGDDQYRQVWECSDLGLVM